MRIHVVILVILAYYGYEVKAQIVAPTESVMLQQEVSFNCCNQYPYSERRDLPMTYCYEKTSKAFDRIFRTTYVALNITPQTYTLFEGGNAEEVWSQYLTHKSSWYPTFLNWRRNNIYLNPFNDSCIGILTYDDYSVRLEILYLDGTRFSLLILGVIAVFFASRLARQPIFFYIVGVSSGVLGSVLFIAYFLLRLLPMRKTLAVGLLTSGTSFIYYGFWLLEKQIKDIYVHAHRVLCWVCGVLSTNQLLGLFSIWSSSGSSEHQDNKVDPTDLWVAVDILEHQHGRILTAIHHLHPDWVYNATQVYQSGTQGIEIFLEAMETAATDGKPSTPAYRRAVHATRT
ncbi:nuclear envelope integral membrane protein 1b-like [Homalodisca vitripennis]|uniref:nuclear envelope integral membrane protein 1b-like n=1 Tax=Homalodisca vitripennis TaxID=197043 RepID=UPI001EEAFF6D|nr:nuclear envelope integral membrane protein 1b-like [Homalodisca vitripennis]